MKFLTSQSNFDEFFDQLYKKEYDDEYFLSKYRKLCDLYDENDIIYDEVLFDLDIDTKICPLQMIQYGIYKFNPTELIAWSEVYVKERYNKLREEWMSIAPFRIKLLEEYNIKYWRIPPPLNDLVFINGFIDFTYRLDYPRRRKTMNGRRQPWCVFMESIKQCHPNFKSVLKRYNFVIENRYRYDVNMMKNILAMQIVFDNEFEASIPIIMEKIQSQVELKLNLTEGLFLGHNFRLDFNTTKEGFYLVYFRGLKALRREKAIRRLKIILTKFCEMHIAKVKLFNNHRCFLLSKTSMELHDFCKNIPDTVFGNMLLGETVEITQDKHIENVQKILHELGTSDVVRYIMVYNQFENVSDIVNGINIKPYFYVWAFFKCLKYIDENSLACNLYYDIVELDENLNDIIASNYGPFDKVFWDKLVETVCDNVPSPYDIYAFDNDDKSN